MTFMKKFTHIVLMGMKHTGKSTLASILAESLGLPFFDTDKVITELCGKTPRALFDEGDAPLMMEKELMACEKLVSGERSVIATGGGLADNDKAIAMLKKSCLMVYIDTPFDLLFGRIMESAKADQRLPRFLEGPDPEGLFKELFTRRSKTYATMADVRIETGARMPTEIAQDIMDYIENE